VVQRLTGPVRAGEARSAGIPVELEFRPRLWVVKTHPQPAARRTIVPSDDLAQSHHSRVESEGSLEVGHADSDVVKRHEGEAASAVNTVVAHALGEDRSGVQLAPPELGPDPGGGLLPAGVLHDRGPRLLSFGIGAT